MRPTPTIAALSDNALLGLRFCDLSPLKAGVEGTRMAPLVAQLHAELAAAGLTHFQPAAYFGDEWFSPEGVPAIAVPFYLAHPRLTRLERAMMTQVEGGSRAWCLKLLRHEAGHCFDHAYGVSATREWRQMFGAAATYDPDVYLPDQASRDFVRHLPGLYAQAHPDEDFAETFAVVVTPGHLWRRRYQGWPVALAKCAYVARLLGRYGPRRPAVATGPDCYAARRMRTTLARHYIRRRAEAAAHAAAVKDLARQRRGTQRPAAN